jgi:hypothetical protein
MNLLQHHHVKVRRLFLFPPITLPSLTVTSLQVKFTQGYLYPFKGLTWLTEV